MFEIPVKEAIVNSDEQIQLLEDDGTVYSDGDCTPSAGGFLLQGWLNGLVVLGSELEVLLGSTTRIIKDVPAAAVAEIAAYTVAVTTTGALANDVFHINTESLDLTPTLFQNKYVQKRYQTTTTRTTAATIVAELVATINADPNAPVTAYAGFNNVTPAQDDTAKIVLVAKEKGVKIDLFKSANAKGDFTLTKVAAGTTVYHTAEDTSAVTVAASLAINYYDSLKNINWSKNFDVDRNSQWFPQVGATYNSYYFRVKKKTADGGDAQVPSLAKKDTVQDFRLYVNVSAAPTLIAALDFLVGDVNV